MKQQTVSSILALEEFKDFKVLAGSGGLDRTVTNMTVMDAPDSIPWSKGGEIVLSSGYLFYLHKKDFSKLIRKFEKKGMAALFIKLHRYFDALPKDVYETAEEINYPIVEVPVDLGFTDVVTPTLSYLLKDTLKELADVERVQEIFTSLVVAGATTSEILQEIQGFLGVELCYYDLGHSTFVMPQGKSFLSQEILQEGIYPIRNKYQTFSVGANKEEYGILIFNKLRSDPSFVPQSRVLAHANTALVLDYQKIRSSEQIADRHRNEFVMDIIMNNIKYEEEVRFRAKTFGWELTGTMRVLVVDIDDFKLEYGKFSKLEQNLNLENTRERINQHVRRCVSSYFSESYYSTFSDSLAFILKYPTNSKLSFDALIRKACEEIQLTTRQKYKFTVSQGIGDERRSVMDLHESFQQAQMCIRIGRVLKKKEAIAFNEDLGIYKLLFSVADNEEVMLFYQEHLRRLQEFDKENNAELFQTLMVIVQEDWNLKRASEVLYLHYNTVKYRYQKIQQILDRDLSLSDQRLGMSLAVKIFQLLPKV